MQADNTAAQIYGRAVFNIAKDRGALDSFGGEVQALADLLATEQGLRLQRFWESPAVLTEDKLAMVDKTLGAKASPLMANLVRMLINKLRIDGLPEVLAELRRLLNEAKGLKPGRVTTAVELDAKQKDKLREALEKRVSQKLALEFEIKPHILGGVIFQYEDKLFDDSLRSRLAELRSRLKRASAPKAA